MPAEAGEAVVGVSAEAGIAAFTPSVRHDWGERERPRHPAFDIEDSSPVPLPPGQFRMSELVGCISPERRQRIC
jgi:hypothetical protein